MIQLELFVLQCFVFGAAGKGKPALLQGLVRQAGQAAEEPTQEQDIPQLRVAVNEVTADWNSKGRQQQGDLDAAACFL